MATYSNEKCGFSFNYPDDFVVQKKFVPSKKNVPECSLKLVFLQRGKVQHAISLRVETKTFDEEANALGLEKSASGWVSSSLGVIQGNVRDIHGPGWNGLSYDFGTRCYGGPEGGYQGMGEGYVAFANAGSRTLIIDGGRCEGSDFDVFQWVTESLKFFP